MIDSLARLDPRVLIVGIGVVALLLALPLEVAAFRRLRRLQIARGTMFFLSGGFVIAIAAGIALIAMNLYTYARLTHEQAAARVSIRQLGERQYVLTVETRKGAAAALPGARRRMADRCARAEVARARQPARLRHGLPLRAPLRALRRHRAGARRGAHRAFAGGGPGPRLVVSSQKTSSVRAARGRALRQRSVRADGRGRGVHGHRVDERARGAPGNEAARKAVGGWK